MKTAALAALALLACDRAPVASCADDLGGVWRNDSGTFHALDLRARVELYPTFRDLPASLPAGVVAAPSVLDLTRTAGSALLRGTITRRYERGTDFCKMQRPATLLRCGADRLVFELSPPGPPTDWLRCTAPAAPLERLELRR